MTRRLRLDTELVRRGLARSREQAADLIGAGRVRVAGRVADKPATQVDTAVAIVLTEPAVAEFVSRGGHKLAGALAAFGLDIAGPDAVGSTDRQGGDTGREGGDAGRAGEGDLGAAGSGGGAGSAGAGLTVAGRVCLDAGASTGGFTEVLLRAGAARVIAVDVGYGQLAWSLRTDPRVRVVERVNVRHLTPEVLEGEVPHLVVADLSFISLTLVLPALVRCAAPDADFVLLVKPQFEVGRGRVGAGGVVRDPGLRAGAVRSVATAAGDHGLGVLGVTASPLPGPSGNVEYFLWLRAGAPPLRDRDLEVAVAGSAAGVRRVSP